MKRFSIPAGSIVRSRTHQRAYDAYRKQKQSTSCQFCEFIAGTEPVVEDYPLFWIVTNIFPYRIWDGSHTGMHLMIVPKRHVDSIGHFTPEECLEYLDLLAQYEASGYSVYLRAAQNKRKSVVHQHTHLIEVGPRIRAQLFIEKPHINITR